MMDVLRGAFMIVLAALVWTSAASAAPVPLDQPVAEISSFMKPIGAPAERIAGAEQPAGLTLIGFDIANPGQAPLNRRLEFEPRAVGPFGFLYRDTAPVWTAIDAQGEGVIAEMLPGRQGITADLRLGPQASGAAVVQLQGVAEPGVWRLWQPAAWERTMAQAMLLRGLFAGALIAAAAWLTGLAVLRFAAAPFWAGLAMMGALTTLLGGAGLTQIQPGMTLLAAAALTGAMMHFAVTILEFYESRRPVAMLFDGLAIACLACGVAAAMGIPGGAWLTATAIQISGAALAALMMWEAATGSAKAKALAAGVLTIVVVALAPGWVSLEWRQSMTAWPMVLEGAFVMGMLIVAFAATAPRHQPISEEEAEQLIAERKTAKDNEYRYALGLAAAHQGLWDWNVENGQLTVSPAVEALLGLTQGALGRSERNWAALVHPEDGKTYETSMNSYRAQGNASFALEVRMKHARGAVRWIQLKASMIAGRRGEAVRCIGVVSDVTDQKQQESAKKNADERLDPVTGLPARGFFLTQLDNVFATVAAAGVPPRGVVMTVEIDRVKAVKESMGEAAGERFLKDIAVRIKESLGPADVLARVGSDEFALLLLPDDFGKTPDTVVMRVREALSKAVHVGQQDIFPAASIGAVALGAQHKQSGDALREAEVAMHHAKRGGAGGYEVYKAEMRPRSAERLSLDADLRRALERNQIEIAFQPIVALRQGGVAGFEALMRWRHHQRGLINPMEFVPLAEETGLIVPLGSFMLKRAAEELGLWRNLNAPEPPPFVSVNVSPRQLFRSDFASEIEQVLRRWQIPASALKLEVTETVVMRDVEKSAAVLTALKQLGVGLSLDDFGTGYSSLSYLHRLPFDALKIDRSFVTTLTTSRDTSAIVNTIMGMARSLNMSVIAEGVESQPEAVKLAQLGCDYAQGFLFGIPMEPQAVEAMLSARRTPGGAQFIRGR
jgi:diguanylate cyclase (GGDEF)-like protein/PAS domain S-box-containing protein